MKAAVIAVLFLCFQHCFAQAQKEFKPIANVRLSFLLFPFTPLLTVEASTIKNLTLQLETNFMNTHGVNLKYFIKSSMNGHYVFTGFALVENKRLRQDNKLTFLPYAGYGNAYRFGHKKHWSLDNRVGIGVSTNADTNSVYPIIKTGIGRIF